MTEAMCCPLSNDGDGPDFFQEDVVRARKEHQCYECLQPIAKGTKHEHVRGMWDGAWSTYRTCLLCVEIRQHFACNGGWVYGQVWEQLCENFFPDMKAGGRCMEGLSPAAKAFLIERRMAWYFDQDECDDSQWDGWTPDKPPRERVAVATVPDTRISYFDDRDRYPAIPEGDPDGELG